jgi:Skp family chaperone for outer membrane proteins
MVRKSTLAVVVAVACLSIPLAPPATAQDYFIPGQQRPAAPPARPARPARPAPPPVQIAPPAAPQPQQPDDGATNEADQQRLPPIPLPPPPDLPALPKGAPPPAAVIGVMGVPEVMRASLAAQQVEKVIGERRAKLNEDAQKEQTAWREMQQALANDRTKLSPEQIRGREKDLQERIANAQRQFRTRNAVIQQAAQVGLAQIERTLIAVIRQVAESRGMNLVLHRAQVALNINEFDITDQVAEQLNKVLPSVDIPAENAALGQTPQIGMTAVFPEAPAGQSGAPPGPTPASATPPSSVPPSSTPASSAPSRH